MMEFLRFARTSAIALIVPLIAYFAASWALGQHAGGPYAATLALARCDGQFFALDSCGPLYRLTFMKHVGFWTGWGSILMLAVFFLLGRVAGTSRARNAAIFPTLMPATAALIAIVLMIQGVSMTLPALFGDLRNFLLTGVLGVLGVGALIGGVSMLRALRRITHVEPRGVLAHQMKRREAPALWEMVESVARKVESRPPDHIIVGLEPNFFATASPIVTPDSEGVLRGETLFLSVPLMRLFSEAELRAVIAHELAHFHGEDTVYSLRFTPVYHRIALLLDALEGEDGESDHIGAAPAALILRYLLGTFQLNESAISRERELEADRIGVAAAGVDALAVSLAKAAVYGQLWSAVRERNVERLNRGKISRNLSRVYADSARYDVSNQTLQQVVAQILETRISHPTDSHPTVYERYQAIGFDQERLSIAALTAQGGASAELFQDLDEVEHDLTMLEHNVMVKVGFANGPVEDVEQNRVVQAGYILAASMVVADHTVANAEISVAEEIGARLFNDFDPTSFREIVAEIHDMPSFEQVVDLLAGLLDRREKAALHAYLAQIAAADQRVSVEENALMAYVAKAWRIDEPVWRRLSPWRRRQPGDILWTPKTRH
ncbi:MAG: M48 family metalloprotease [Neomegalonema sp.]|nr:M48 family metalloprotease [Neomegalonema sp.]